MFSELGIIIKPPDAHSHYIATLFMALRAVNEVRQFELVLLLKPTESGEVLQESAEIIDTLTARDLLDFLDSPPTVRIV